MPSDQKLDTHHKALTLNLDPSRFGSFAEIGAGVSGQEDVINPSDDRFVAFAVGKWTAEDWPAASTPDANACSRGR
jgi:hypothetical protein